MTKPVYLQLPPGGPLPAIDAAPSRMVLILEQACSPFWRMEVIGWLLGVGCLYAMTWGVDCEAWHDDIDHANMEAFDFGDIPDERFVMTTWHAHEPLKEAFWFAKYNANHSTVALDRLVLLDVARENREAQMLRAYAKA